MRTSTEICTLVDPWVRKLGVCALSVLNYTYRVATYEVCDDERQDERISLRY